MQYRLTINNLLQSIKTCSGSVDLSSSVVTDDNAITANLNTLLGIGYTLNALDGEWLAAAHLLPGLDKPGHLLPAMSSTMPDIVNPLGTCFIRFLLGVNAVFGEPLLEDWIRQTQISTNTVVESVVAVCYIIVSPSQLPCAVKTLSIAAFNRRIRKVTYSTVRIQPVKPESMALRNSETVNSSSCGM